MYFDLFDLFCGLGLQPLMKERDRNPLLIVAVRLNSAEESLAYIKIASAGLCDLNLKAGCIEKPGIARVFH